jgi:hypothetical protein
MNKWRSLAENGHPPVGTVCAYGVDDPTDDPSVTEPWTKGDEVKIISYHDGFAVIYNRTREADDIRNLDYGEEGPLVVALDEAVNDAPDWGNAPEDATHWEPASDEDDESWMKKDGEDWYFWGAGVSKWIKYNKTTNPIVEDRIKAMIPRPQVEPKEWSGEGLPPVGTVCEYIDASGKYHQVEITGYGRSLVLFVVEGSSNEQCTAKDPHLFRPIRSEEDRAVEEMAKVFNSNCAVDYSGQPLLDGMKALYREGYRKQEKK